MSEDTAGPGMGLRAGTPTSFPLMLTLLVCGSNLESPEARAAA